MLRQGWDVNALGILIKLYSFCFLILALKMELFPESKYYRKSFSDGVGSEF